MPVTVRLSRKSGFTLVELVLIIIIIGILSSVAMLKLSGSVSSAQVEQTKREMDQLAAAIVGNPDTYGSGSRSDFGYVGDVGALPTDLDALVQNPGGYSTWNGPYMGTGFGAADFKKDAWGTVYTLAGTTLRSTGSGSNIDKELAASSSALLANALEGVILDADRTAPGSTYKDSLLIRLAYPNGSGGTTIGTATPSANGRFSFWNLPIGDRLLQVIYRPATDTIIMPVTIYPGRAARLDIVFPADLW